MSTKTIHSKDGRLRIELTIEDDGLFTIGINATQVLTSIRATMEQDMRATHVDIRGHIQDEMVR